MIIIKFFCAFKKAFWAINLINHILEEAAGEDMGAAAREDAAAADAACARQRQQMEPSEG